MKNLKKKIILITSIILLMLFLINKTFFFEKGIFENIANDITYPIIQLCHYITQPVKNFLQKKENYKELQKKYLGLLEQKENLELENIKLQSTLQQYSLSQDLIDFQQRYNMQNHIFAKIIVKNFSENEHSFVINKGKKHGVEENMSVAYKFQLLGKVIEVFNSYSKVLLITDQNCKVAAYTNSTNAHGIVIGNNTINNCQLEYVDHLSKIETDDLIISSGQGLIFPEGFCLGKITTYTKDGLYYKIKLEPLVDFKSLKFCLLTNQEKLDAF